MEIHDFLKNVTFKPIACTFHFEREGEKKRLGNLTGWACIPFESEQEALKFEAKLGEFIAQAINEKLERESTK